MSKAGASEPPVKKRSSLGGTLGAVALVAAVTAFLLYRFDVFSGDGSVKNAPAPADQLLQQIPEPERKKAREQAERVDETPMPKPPAGS